MTQRRATTKAAGTGGARRGYEEVHVCPLGCRECDLQVHVGMSRTLVDQPGHARGFQLGPERIQIGPGKPESLGDVLGRIARTVQPIRLELA